MSDLVRIEPGSIDWFTVASTLNRVTRVHVLPEDDLRIHDVDMEGRCWCKPCVHPESGLLVHNSLDGREAYERGERLWH